MKAHNISSTMFRHTIHAMRYNFFLQDSLEYGLHQIFYYSSSESCYISTSIIIARTRTQRDNKLRAIYSWRRRLGDGGLRSRPLARLFAAHHCQTNILVVNTQNVDTEKPPPMVNVYIARELVDERRNFSLTYIISVVNLSPEHPRLVSTKFQFIITIIRYVSLRWFTDFPRMYIRS